MVDRQYSTKSACDKGTLYQLKQVVNRTSFGKEPKHNIKATEDFMEVVLYSHILAAANECSGSSGMSCEEVAKWIVSTFVYINYKLIIVCFCACKFSVFVSSALWLYFMMYVLVYVIVFCVVNVCMLPQPGKNSYADWYEFKSKIKSNQNQHDNTFI